MPASDYAFDPTGTSPANRIASETKAIDATLDVSVWPLHYPFYGYSLVVEGRKTPGGPWEEMNEHFDYMLSPPYLDVMGHTGRNVSSYFVIRGEWAEVRYDYQAVGQYVDTKLLTYIAELEADDRLDRTSISSWASMDGLLSLYDIRARDPEIINRSWQEVMNTQLDRINIALANPNTTRPIDQEAKLTDLESQLNGKASNADLTNLSARYDQTTTVTANNAGNIYTYPKTLESVEMRVVFVPTDGTYSEQVTVTLLQTGNDTSYNYRDTIVEGGNASRVSIGIVDAGTNMTVTGTATVEGKFHVKSIMKV